MQDISSDNQLRAPMLTLLDVVHEAPQVISSLCAASCAALSACSKQFHELVLSIHNQNTVSIVIYDPSDLPVVVKRDWPSLVLIMLVGQARNLVTWPTDCRFELLGKLALDVDSRQTALFVTPMPSKQHQRQQQQPHTELAINSINSACVQLNNPKWRLVTVALRCPLKEYMTPCISGLASFCWPALKLLTLSDNPLDAVGATRLAAGFSAHLTGLRLRDCCLHHDILQELAKPCWPQLRHLCLMDNKMLDMDSAISLAGASHFPMLKSLNMRGLKPGLISFSGLSESFRGRARQLDLGRNMLTVGSIVALVATPWARLKVLQLDDGNLGAEAIAGLVAGSISELKFLSLSSNQLDSMAMKILARSSWPELVYLDLDNNKLTDTAMIYLAKGYWPALGELKLGGHSIGVAGVGCLLAAQWPDLDTLSLPKTTVCSTTWDALNLDMSALENVLTAQVHSVMVTRVCEAGRVQVWPQLKIVEFSPP